MIKAYQRERISFIKPSQEEINRIKEMGIIPITGNFIERGWQGKRLLHKLDTIRHDPIRVRKALMKIFEEGGRGRRSK
jgi:hypothetical protein